MKNLTHFIISSIFSCAIFMGGVAHAQAGTNGQSGLSDNKSNTEALTEEQIKSAEKLLKKSSGIISFIENIGQVKNTEIKYVSEGNQKNIAFQNDKIWFSLLKPNAEDKSKFDGHRWNMEFVGMNPNAKLEPREKLKTTYNMYLPNINVSGANSYNELWYNEVYSNIDLRFYASEKGNLEYDYIIKPNGNIGDIQYKLNGLDDVFVDKEGNLVMTTSLGQIAKSKPFTYQKINGETKYIKSSYHVSEDNIVSISIDEPYNNKLPLVIDPVLLDWANMLGWYSFDEVQSAEVDANGNGIQDVTETTGIDGVKVSIYRDVNGNNIAEPTGADTLVSFTLTSSGGQYLFPNLSPGNYFAVFSNLPAGYFVSPTLQGGDPAKDSDGSAGSVLGTWVTPVTNLISTEWDTTWDLGAYSTICPSFSFTPVVLPSGTQGIAYSQNLIVSGGTAPYTWSIVSSSLPNGLSLSSFVGSSIILSGTPYYAGTNSFTLEVVDGNGCKDRVDYTILINSTNCVTPPAVPVLWAVDEDATRIHLWSFESYLTPTTTATDYGRMKYKIPGFAGTYNFANTGSPDMEAMAVVPTTGKAYFMLSSRLKITNGAPADGPSETQALFSYDLNQAKSNIGNIILTLEGHIQRPTNGRAMESLTYDPSTNRLYMADPVGGGQNTDTQTDVLYYLNLSTLNPNPLLTTTATLVGAITGLGEDNKYVDGLEIDESGNLYTVDGTDDDVYIVDKNTGAITSIYNNNVIGGAGASTDIETLVWDPVNNKMLGVDNNGHNIINLTSGNGGNIIESTFIPGTPGLPSDADFEGSAMWAACLDVAPLNSIGDKVWRDDDKDGVQDAGEPGVAGVTVTLYNSSNAVMGSTITDAYGNYLFTNLVDGSYSVGYTLPANYTFTVSNTPGDNGNNTNSDANTITGKTGLFALSGGENELTADAGIIFNTPPTTANVGDRVWYDIDTDGVQDAGEPGVSGVTVTLYNSGIPVATTITDDNGNYLFTNVPPAANYTVGFSLPPSFVFTTKDQGGNDNTDSDADNITGLTGVFNFDPTSGTHL